ncbi:8-amino-7-oxononanoate synthase [Aquitalea sp. LB_tupeE]|uniref:8-amino-7-oxononanoate synthase n=1 Tax=Aquitalea sp. LB_tupeE TaxID=2748078 RepID=UPI0015BEB66E|nr:8-amino-7-oxononanoate synthase [Aquitalea sp. LB_tupeE]NWK77595.1 8-amino-7-oxononanoate synthase [Aquitalea sp. LB_tupeE]
MRAQDLSAALLQLQQQHRLRQRHLLETPQSSQVVIDGKSYIAFASNDYLGLANHPALIEATRAALQQWGVGGGASHLVAGHFAIHEQAEQALADFCGSEAALMFSSGYAANQAVITSLVGRGDAVFADKLNHASLNDACLLSRASFRRFRHNDVQHLEELLATTPARTRLIAVDAVYSMDGDEAPLKKLLELADKYDAWLYIDDAHGFGVLGNGHGSAAEQEVGGERLIYMATLGKAAGVAGAFVAGSAQLVQWLVNSARTYIYTTAQPPALAAAVLASLQLIASEPWRRECLQQHVSRVRERLADVNFQLMSSRTPIQPIIIGRNEQAMLLAAQLKARGYWVPAIRPPTVPEGTARLRMTLSAAHTPEQLEGLLDCVVSAIQS